MPCSHHAYVSAPRGHELARLGVILVVAISFACTAGDGQGPEPEAPASSVATTLAEAPAPAASTAAEPVPPAPEASEPGAAATGPTLEDLLRLPASSGQVDPLTGRPKRKPEVGDSGGKSGERQRLQLELKTSNDGASARPSTTRSRTDAGVSVDVADKIRLKGGVRLEEESGHDPDDPMPTLGIEKRF